MRREGGVFVVLLDFVCRFRTYMHTSGTTWRFVPETPAKKASSYPNEAVGSKIARG